MASYTTNYNLRKPTAADNVNVALDIAGNMDLLDAHAHSGTYVPVADLAAHLADTSNVHGIPDTSDIERALYVVTIPASVVPSTHINWSTRAADTTVTFGIKNSSSGAQNAEVGYDVYLQAGTCTLSLTHSKGTNRGIYTAQLDGITVGTIDGYAASTTNGLDTTSFTVATTGLHRIKLKMLTKNASSSSYFGIITSISLTVAQASAVAAGTAYVDTVSGNDANSGATPATAFLTLGAALAAGATTVKVYAPQLTPLREQLAWTTATNITIECVDPADVFYWYGSNKYANGAWTSVGSGVYSRDITGYPTTTMVVAVTTLTETVGGVVWPSLRLAENTATPTTPAAGEFGVSGTTLYVRLPGDANPGTHTFELSALGACVHAYGAGRVTIKRGHFYFSGGRNVLCGLSTQPSGTGKMTLQDCLSAYARDSGFATQGQIEEMIATGSKAYRNGNDGWNHHSTAGAALMSLDNCEGSYNNDEGASPHEDSNLVITDSRFDYNGHGGMNAVDTSSAVISDSTFNANFRLTPDFGNEAGIHYAAGTSGSLTNVTVTNTGQSRPGVRTEPGSSVTITNLTSGLAQGNGAADEIA